jgi:protein ImuA
MSSSTLLRNLQAQIGRLESAGRNPRRTEWVSTGFAALDRLLPHGGLAGGTLIEWLGAGEGNGALTLALAVGGRIARQGGVLAVVSEWQAPFPPAAAALGVPLERALVVRPPDSRTSLWVWEQALRCEAVAATIGRMDRAGEVVMRRLQLAVEAGGGLGFLVRPPDCRAETAWAEARLLVKALPSRADAWRLRVELLRARGGFGGGTAEVEVSHEADDVRVVSELADSARAE